MALVPEKMLETMQYYQKQNIAPLTTNLVQMDNKMGDILQRKDLSVDDKAKMYAQTLQRYLTMYDKQNNPESSLATISDIPSTINTSGQSSEEEVYKEPSHTTIFDQDMMESVPKSMRSRAQSLLKKLKKHEDIVSYNDKGELIYKNKTYPGTNFTDLFQDVLRQRKTFKPPGVDTFLRALGDINLPADLVKNVDRRKLMIQYRDRSEQSPSHIHQSLETPTSLSQSQVTSKTRRRLNPSTPKTASHRWIHY